MKYIQFINEQIGKQTAGVKNLVLFGQNIAAGSHISGLTKGLVVGEGGRVINATNSESTLAGLGFGMMINGVSSIFLMKQQDFLLLGIDQLTDTYNFVRRKKPKASYTIVFVIVDNGYQGLQSSLNNFGDFCSIARIPGFTLTNKVDAEEIIGTHLVSPGFRIIGVSQRLFGQELLETSKVYSNSDKTLFQYLEGSGATVACFNLSLPYGLVLAEKLKEKNIHTSLFSVNAVTPIAWDRITESAHETGKLVVIDDSKSENVSCDNLLVDVLQKYKLKKLVIVKKVLGDNWLSPNADELSINYSDIVAQLSSEK